jgi:pectinesterase inhibitor-like protein
MTILKPITLFILILCTTLVVTQSQNVQPKNSNDLIEQTCKKTPNYALCIQYLKPYSSSSNASVNGLAIIMFGIMKDKALDTQGKIHTIVADILPRDPFVPKAPLLECNNLYESIIVADVTRAINALQGSPDLKLAESCANDAKSKANKCELKFKIGDSPLTDENNDMNDVAILAAAIVRASKN